MSIQITPSREVEIDLSEATEDELLHVHTRDGKNFYFAVQHSEARTSRLTLVPELTAPEIEAAARRASQHALRDVREYYLDELKEWLGEDTVSPTDILGKTTQAFLDTAYVLLPQVGQSLRVSFGNVALGNRSYLRAKPDWTSFSEVQHIASVDRFKTMVLAACRL